MVTLRIVGGDPDAPVRAAKLSRARALSQRAGALGIPEACDIADHVTGGPGVVGRMLLAYNVRTGRIEVAAPGAIKAPDAEGPEGSVVDVGGVLVESGTWLHRRLAP